MPSQAYLDDPGLNFHQLQYYRENGARAWHRRFVLKEPEPADKTDNFRQGRLLHLAVLEPHKLNDPACVQLVDDKFFIKSGLTTNAKKLEELASLDIPEGCDVCSALELEHYSCASRNVRAEHSALFDSIIRIEEERMLGLQGVAVKACADMRIRSPATGMEGIIDVKSISDLGKRHQHIVDYCYAEQIAWYYSLFIDPDLADFQRIRKTNGILFIEKESGKSMLTWLRPETQTAARARVMQTVNEVRSLMNGTRPAIAEEEF